MQRHAGPKPSSWLGGWVTCAHNCSVTPPNRAWPAGAVLSDWVLGFQKRGMGEAGWPPRPPAGPRVRSGGCREKEQQLGEATPVCVPSRT